MNTNSTQLPEGDQARAVRDAQWASPVSRLKMGARPGEAVNLNVDGRRLTGPLKGFGQMWQKTYLVRLGQTTHTPAAVIDAWKNNFGSFWPTGNHFYGSMTGIAPGDVALLNLAGPGGLTGPGGAPMISTGVMVIYADDVSFSFMTPEGHIFAGMITFSATDEEDGLVTQIQVLVRANDPIYELGCRLGVIHKTEDAHWQATLTNLAAHLGVPNARVEQKNVLVDPRLQWGEAKNIWHNAAVRTGLYMPVTLARRMFGKG
jgi:hypothetical protein